MATKLTRAEEFYVVNNPDNLSVKELAEQFKVTGQTIRNMQKLNKKTKAKVEVNTEPVSTPVQEDNNKVVTETTHKVENDFNPFDKAIGRHSRKGQVVATVMTEAAAGVPGPKKTLSESMKSAIGPTRKPKNG